jgi:hypothetical protein
MKMLLVQGDIDLANAWMTAKDDRGERMRPWLDKGFGGSAHGVVAVLRHGPVVISARELYPRVGFIVTNLKRPAERVSQFYNGRGAAEQWIKEGKLALRWTRLSCHAFRHNAVRLQLHALAYNLANFLRSLALPDQVAQWTLTTLRAKLVKIGARIVRHGRYVVQLAEVAVPRLLFAEILRRIGRLRGSPVPAT